jgi:hypothetical protein
MILEQIKLIESNVDGTAIHRMSMIVKTINLSRILMRIRFKNVMKRIVVTTMRNVQIIAVISLIPLMLSVMIIKLTMT